MNRSYSIAIWCRGWFHRDWETSEKNSVGQLFQTSFPLQGELLQRHGLCRCDKGSVLRRRRHSAPRALNADQSKTFRNNLLIVEFALADRRVRYGLRHRFRVLRIRAQGNYLILANHEAWFACIWRCSGFIDTIQESADRSEPSASMMMSSLAQAFVCFPPTDACSILWCSSRRYRNELLFP